MDPIYRAALAKVNAACASFERAMSSPDISGEERRNLRERRDYWHVLGSRIRRRMERNS